ncbi:hypothetical protein EIP91_010042 [Steccherinum ochraceum]|uniref:F-box domain-containing protein n=1 Tax=Steccherinum ochraceum TaxID=92696 RepID=A0A4R0R384_9APHY|nr:hypothetical protein EIP91_010042 [Steccherinum ochraceum]
MDTRSPASAPISSFSSVDELPYELLDDIFKEAVQEDMRSYFPNSYKTLRLSQVCRYWRSATQNSPRLWSIDLRYPDTAHHFSRFVKGPNATLYVACDRMDSRARAWPHWLYSYAKDGGVKDVSVRIPVGSCERFLRSVLEDLPGLEWLDMHVDISNWGGFDRLINFPVPFLRSVTLVGHRPRNLYYPPVETLSLFSLLKHAPFLRSLRLESCRLNDTGPAQLQRALSLDTPLPMTKMCSWSFVGINRLCFILDNVVINPSQSVLDIDDIGRLNLMGELSATSRERLRGAVHTHLAITTTSIETYSKSGGAYKFKRLRNHVTLVQALVSYGRAFHWNESITHLSLNPDGSMLSASISTRADEAEEESWDEVMAPAWLKLFCGLGNLTHLTLTGFKIANVFNALHPREGQDRKTGEKVWRTSCPALEVIVLMDFAFGDYAEEEDGEELEMEGEACRFAKLDMEMLARFVEARQRVDKGVRSVVLCHCLQAEVARTALKNSVTDVVVR